MDEDSQPMRILKLSRYFWSFLIVGFSGFIIFYGILANESGFNRSYPDCPPGASFVIFWFLIFFFGFLEAAHVCVVDLSKHSNETFKDKYKGTVSVHKLISGPRIMNLSKFLMGRQVMVIFNQFFLGSLASFPGMVFFPWTTDAFPSLFKKILIDTGLFNVVFVTTFGSLVPQLIATRYPVQMMNTIPVRMIVVISLGIEASGIAHFSWVLHNIIAKFSGLNYEVTTRVMADDPEQAKNEQPTTVQTRFVPETKTSDGEWKNTKKIAQEFKENGSAVPNGITANSMRVIAELLKLAESNPELASISNLVYA